MFYGSKYISMDVHVHMPVETVEGNACGLTP